MFELPRNGTAGTFQVRGICMSPTSGRKAMAWKVWINKNRWQPIAAAAIEPASRPVCCSVAVTPTFATCRAVGKLGRRRAMKWSKPNQVNRDDNDKNATLAKLRRDGIGMAVATIERGSSNGP